MMPNIQDGLFMNDWTFHVLAVIHCLDSHIPCGVMVVITLL